MLTRCCRSRWRKRPRLYTLSLPPPCTTGNAFKALSGKAVGGFFAGIQNPIAGVMVGILATVLLQSSSTTTSIVVSMVGADIVSVRTAIPMIMGANIGTSVTNTIVSHGHVTDKEEFQRAVSRSEEWDGGRRVRGGAKGSRGKEGRERGEERCRKGDDSNN